MVKRLLGIFLAAALVSACSIFGPDEKKPKSFDRVMILYSAGYNNISSYLAGDIDDLAKSYVPSRHSSEALVVISHQPESYGNYTAPTSPVLVYMSSDPIDGRVSRDTLYSAGKGALLTDPEVISEMLSKAAEFFPSDHYSLVVSSHGTGWLPESYYEKGYNNSFDFFAMSPGRRVEINEISSRPVKTIGQEMAAPKQGEECGLSDFAEALPFRFDAILLDACLMGGIEVAYELRGKTDFVAFSQTEILADGLDYSRLAQRLLRGEGLDFVGVCEDYFALYSGKSGIDRSATISLVDCSSLESLADACRDAFETVREKLGSLNPAKVQRYFRYNCHWFYDLEDILVKADLDGAKLTAVRSAIDRAVVYKAATPEFMKSDNGFAIETYCGLSMYLPCNGDAYLDSYYRDLAWNKATGLVE